MKILIADDNPKRYSTLCDKLYNLGISKNDINIAGSTTDATNLLETCEYDLLIIDLVLPIFSQETATDCNSSMELIERIKIDNTFKRPSYVIGISADINLINDNKYLFTEISWNILLYEAHTDQWMNTILKYCNYNLSTTIKKTPSVPSHDHLYDIPSILIVCALDKETNHLLTKKAWNWEPAATIDGIVYNKGSFQDENKVHRNIFLCTLDEMGMVATAVYTTKLISKFKIDLLCMIGICAGDPNKTNFGDIIFAESVWNYQSGKLVLNPEDNFSILKSRAHYISSDTNIKSKLKVYRKNNPSFIKALRRRKFQALSSVSPQIRFGNIASGSTVLADGVTIDQILNQDGNTIAVEMEIYGLFAAAFWANEEKRPKFFALKSVCDFADPNKADIAQEYAILTSTEILFDFLTKHIHEII